MPVVRVPLGERDGRSRWTVTHEGRDYLVLDLGDRVVVTDALCPHKKLPLADGIIRDGALVCPGHWYAFDLETGECRTTRETALSLHPVVHDGGLCAEVDTAAPQSLADRLRAHARGE